MAESVRAGIVFGREIKPRASEPYCRAVYCRTSGTLVQMGTECQGQHKFLDHFGQVIHMPTECSCCRQWNFPTTTLTLGHSGITSACRDWALSQIRAQQSGCICQGSGVAIWNQSPLPKPPIPPRIT